MKKINKLIYFLLPKYIKMQYELDLFSEEYHLMTPLFLNVKQWYRLLKNREIKSCEAITLYNFEDKKDCNCYYSLPPKLMDVETQAWGTFLNPNLWVNKYCIRL